MIEPGPLQHMTVDAAELTNRQREATTLIAQYLTMAHEMPSSGWLSRRLQVSRQRAYWYLSTYRDRRRSPR